MTAPLLKPTDENIARAVDILRHGGLVAIPTETVYGLACDGANPEAVAKLYAAKGRPSFNPLIAHVSGLQIALGELRPVSGLTTPVLAHPFSGVTVVLATPPELTALARPI